MKKFTYTCDGCKKIVTDITFIIQGNIMADDGKHFGGVV